MNGKPNMPKLRVEKFKPRFFQKFPSKFMLGVKYAEARLHKRGDLEGFVLTSNAYEGPEEFTDGVDFVLQRAEAIKLATQKPDSSNNNPQNGDEE